MRWAALALVAALLVAEISLAQTAAYRPGFYRLATKSAFMGRVRLESAMQAPGGCGLVHEATVVETIAGAAPGTRLRFIARVEPGTWAIAADHFAMLFAHALDRDDPSQRCWVDAAPLFAARTPVSVVPFDAAAGSELGGEFLPIASDSVLEGLRFAGFELWLDGKGHKLASWELVKAYARQTPAVLRAMPSLPDSGSVDADAPPPTP